MLPIGREEEKLEIHYTPKHGEGKSSKDRRRRARYVQ
jgi:hypothetical protein